MAMYDKGEPKMECAQSNRALGQAVQPQPPPSPIDETIADLDRYLAKLFASTQELHKRLVPVMANESNDSEAACEPAPIPQCELDSTLRSFVSRVRESERSIREIRYRLQL
jgi:hypothetical protein